MDIVTVVFISWMVSSIFIICRCANNSLLYAQLMSIVNKTRQMILCRSAKLRYKRFTCSPPLVPRLSLEEKWTAGTCFAHVFVVLTFALVVSQTNCVITTCIATVYTQFLFCLMCEKVWKCDLAIVDKPYRASCV